MTFTWLSIDFKSSSFWFSFCNNKFTFLTFIVNRLLFRFNGFLRSVLISLLKFFYFFIKKLLCWFDIGVLGEKNLLRKLFIFIFLSLTLVERLFLILLDLDLDLDFDLDFDFDFDFDFDLPPDLLFLDFLLLILDF